jgi:hypothetical protein
MHLFGNLFIYQLIHKIIKNKMALHNLDREPNLPLGVESSLEEDLEACVRVISLDAGKP